MSLLEFTSGNEITDEDIIKKHNQYMSRYGIMHSGRNNQSTQAGSPIRATLRLITAIRLGGNSFLDSTMENLVKDMEGNDDI